MSNQQALSHSFAKWAKDARLSRKLTLALIIVALCLGIATYNSFYHTDLWGSNPKALLVLLNVDFIVLLLLAAIIAKRLTKLWGEHKTGQASAKLHSRFVMMFSLFTITPTIILTIFSGLFFNMGLQTWFGDRIKTALEESTTVAKAYLAEHQKVIGASVYSMAQDIGHDYHELVQNQQMFNEALDIHIEARNLDEAIVFDAIPEVVARSKLSFALEFEVVTPRELETAKSEVVIHTSNKEDRVRALYKLPNADAYLLVGRLVDPAVAKRIRDVESTVSHYHELEQHRGRVELYFFLMYIAVTLLLLMTAIWVALSFATRIVRPIVDLISAAEEVRSGNLDVQVNDALGKDEIGILMKSFNRMTSQLREQKQKLLQANEEIDTRRKFIEDVLEGVSAGVISVDQQGIVQIMNTSAAEFLGLRSSGVGKKLKDIFAEVVDLLKTADASNGYIQSQLPIQRRLKSNVLLVRVVREGTTGFIITFDDITELVQAQRKAAWADVAKRIAHEIRNPLTPIQLSAERLKRKYANQITDEPEKFNSCVDTIIRQVTHLGDMVKEFSNFSRMPEPKMKECDWALLLKQSVDLEKHTQKDITFEFTSNVTTLNNLCDAGQMGQVMTNLLQNSIDSIKEKKKTNDLKDFQGAISVKLEKGRKSFSIIITDNGLGFPKENREMLTEPYVTKKEKGTGLGLAIVKKIIEDHGGTLTLLDNPKTQGACVCLEFIMNLNKKAKE